MSTLIEVSEFELWFKKHQSLISKVLIALLTAGAIYTLYVRQQKARLNEAAVLLYTAEAAVEKDNALALQGAATRLKDHYAETHHASLAMLQLARYQAEKKQWKESEATTRWIMQHAALPAFVDSARIHLAQLQIQAHQWDTALATLKAPFSQTSFEPAAAELTADILAIKGEMANARSHYQKALNTHPQGHPYRDLIQHKLNTLAP